MTPNFSRAQPATRLDSVQMLRAIAAVTVVTHHISLFANGEWGVDLFVMLSTLDAGRVTSRNAILCLSASRA